jgi:drug/metabolite transporter (DMT)-like permease
MPMSLRGLLLVLACVVLLAVGQLLFKFAALQWRVDGWTWSSARNLLSPTLMLAMLLYALATVMWVYALRTVPLTVAFPIYALTFIIVPVLAYFFAGEPLTLKTLAGAAVIMLGVLISVR